MCNKQSGFVGSNTVSVYPKCVVGAHHNKTGSFALCSSIYAVVYTGYKPTCIIDKLSLLLCFGVKLYELLCPCRPTCETLPQSLSFCLTKKAYFHNSNYEYSTSCKSKLMQCTRICWRVHLCCDTCRVQIQNILYVLHLCES